MPGYLGCLLCPTSKEREEQGDQKRTIYKGTLKLCGQTIQGRCCGFILFFVQINFYFPGSNFIIIPKNNRLALRLIIFAFQQAVHFEDIVRSHT